MGIGLLRQAHGLECFGLAHVEPLDALRFAMCRSARAVGDDVHERAARLTQHEAPNSPPSMPSTPKPWRRASRSLIRSATRSVGHLYRDARGRRVVVADDVQLGRAVRRRHDGRHPAEVHGHLQAEQVDEEVARLCGPIRLDVGHRPADRHAPCSIAFELHEARRGTPCSLRCRQAGSPIDRENVPQPNAPRLRSRPRRPRGRHSGVRR